MGKRGARFYPPAEKPTLPNKNEVGFTSNATNLENKMELYGPPTGMHMKREKNFSRVVCISLVAGETGIFGVGMIEGAPATAGLAAGLIFRVGSTRVAAAIASLAVSDTTMVNSALAGSTVVLVDTSALENDAINKTNVSFKDYRGFSELCCHRDAYKEKWKLPVENEEDYSVGNPAVTRCTEIDQMTCAEFPREETFEQDVNSVNGSESSSKYNVYLMRCDCDSDCCYFVHLKERILSESQIERSFGNNATIDFPISDVSKKIGYTKQKICQHILIKSTQQEDWSHLNGCVSGYIPEIASCKDRDSVNSQISLEVYENDLMDKDEDSFLAISAEEINIEHVEQDLWKWLHLDKTYGENTQRNCVAYPTVRSCTEIDSVISQTSLEIYENDIMETDQITCAEFPSEGTFKQDVNCNSSGHLSVNGNESCKQNEEGILSEIQIERSFGNSATLDLPSSDVSTKKGYTKQKICQHILLESTHQEDGIYLNGCSSGYMSVNASCKDQEQMTCAEFPKDETFEQDVNSHYSGYLSVTGNESSKDNEEGILSEFPIERSFGNSATLNLSSSDVSKTIGYTKQKICQHILLESTQQEDGSHLDRCSSGYMSVNASCKNLDQMTCAEFPNDETFEQDVNSHSSGHLSVTGNESIKDNDQITCAEFPKDETFEQDVNSHSFGHLSVTANESSKDNEEVILSEFPIERSFGNSATLNLPGSDVSKKIGHTKQKIYQHILFESTQQEDGTHLNGCSSGYMSVNASCKKQDQMTCAEFPKDETFEQDVNSHSSGYLLVTDNESGKDNEEGILSEIQIERSFGNSATLDMPSSDVSKKKGYTKQKICQHIFLESTQQEDGIYLNGCLSGYMSVNASCKDQDQMTCAEFPREETFEQDVNYHSSGHLSVTGNESCKQNDSKRLDWYSEQSDGKDHPDSKVNENEDDLCSRETIKCQRDRVEEWLISNDFERMNTDIDDYTGCGENEIKRFENSITQCNKECKCEKISKDKAITDISCLTRSCSNIKAKSLNKDNDSGQLDSFPDAHPLHDRSKANLHEHFETHAKIKGNFQTNPLYCISITPKTESMLYPQESQRDSNETKTIASSSRKSNSLQNISNNESKHKIKTSLLDTNPAPLTLPDPFHRDVLVVV